MTLSKKRGLLIGGSGLIGGALMHYFKRTAPDAYEILSPNSKKLSLRVTEDITQYFNQYRPSFIINTAISSIDSDPQLAFETNYLGAINLARVAIVLKIPYIHFSSAAVLPMRLDLTERPEDRLQLQARMSNYTKSKLMAELTLEHLKKTEGLDYTIIRLGVVYGKHDHKIQGFHQLLFSIASQSMPFLITRRGVMHSYSNTKKLPPFVHHILERREEFSGETYNFIDRKPVELVELILKIKALLGADTPREFFIPYPLARFGKSCLQWLIRRLNRIGFMARMPAELMFMENFYQSQTLSPEKLTASSFGEPQADVTVFTMLPEMLEYYLTRWAHLNLIPPLEDEFFDPKKRADEFYRTPQELLDNIHQKKIDPFADFHDLDQ